MCFGFISVYYILFYEHIMPVSRLDWYKPMYKLPLYFGTVIYAYEGIGVVSLKCIVSYLLW